MAAAAGAAAGKKKKKGGGKEDEGPKLKDVEVLASDMPEDERAKVFAMTAQAFEAEKVEKDQATTIKKLLEKEFDGMWHVIVGACFGLSITNETKRLLFFRTGLAYVVVFRTLDEEKQAIDNAPPPEGDDDGDDDVLDEDGADDGADAA